MTPRFPPPPWLRDPPHRTLAEVEETRQLWAAVGRWANRGYDRVEARARLAELRARAVEPEREK